MAYPVLIIGKSGSGKSTSLRNMAPDSVGIFNVLGKPLPFRGKFDQIVSDDYNLITGVILKNKKAIYVIDDAGYLLTNNFMRGHSDKGRGSSKFDFYNELADSFWRMVNDLIQLPTKNRVYIMMHEEAADSGDIKPKTIGKLIDEKVCLEGMFSICLRCMLSNGRHVFRTQSDGLDVAKSPMGMFEDLEIDNDLAYVDQKICEYYEIGGANA